VLISFSNRKEKNIMDYLKGDQIPLFTEFKQDDKIIKVESPRVRVLQERDNQIYEVMTWKSMSPFVEGYMYMFNSSICDYPGEYVVVFSGKYNENTLNQLDKFNLKIKTQSSSNQIKIYGIVNDMGDKHFLQDTKITFTNMITGSIASETTSDYSGAWECFVYPGRFNVIFSKDRYHDKILQIQIGDEKNEIQFNTISLESQSQFNHGSGMYRVNDNFTSKNGLGIENINISIYHSNSLDEVLVNVVTDYTGKWEVFLDDGSYVLKAQLPSGLIKVFDLQVQQGGEHLIKEIVSNNATTISGENTTLGSNVITDFVQDAHGNGIANVKLSVYKEDKLIGNAFTLADGSFSLNLDSGTYKITCEHDNFKSYSWELKI